VSIIAAFLEIKCILTYSTSYGQLLGEYQVSLDFFTPDLCLSRNENGVLGYQYLTALAPQAIMMCLHPCHIYYPQSCALCKLDFLYDCVFISAWPG
jgi:hypothetical protein